MATINSVIYQTSGSYYHELFSWTTGPATVYAGGGFDFINASFSSHNDFLVGGWDRDIIWAQHGDDVIFGDEPSDGEGNVVPENGDEGDSIIAGTGNDWVQAGGGDDYVNGESGQDQLYGGVGSDFLMGGNDADTIYGGAGNDTLVGGYASGSTIPPVHQFTITLNRNGADDMPYENDIASTFGGTLFFDNSRDVLDGGDGNDRYIIDTSNDVVIDRIGEGNDWVVTSVTYALATGAEIETLSATSSGSTAVIHLTGNGTGQTMEGNAAAQTLTGNGGNDWLTGFGGRDTLWGGGQNDRFIFSAITHSGSAVATADRIMDFRDTAGEQDLIDLRGIDANTGAANDQAFVLDTNGSFSTGEIRQTLINSGADLLLEFNNDLDAASNMAVILVGRTTLLDNADFML